MMKKNAFSLVEMMVVLAALAGVALLVTKLGKNTKNIQTESMESNDYNDLVRESHFIISNLKSCKVSLAGTSFQSSAISRPIANIELWTADSKGKTRVKKKLAKGEKFGSLLIEDIILEIDPEVPSPNSGDIKNTTGILKVIIAKPKSRTTLADIEHSIKLNYSVNPSNEKNTIIDCEDEHESKEKATVWCGEIQNPCGPEVIQAVAVGKFENGKFTGIFQPKVIMEGKICTAALNQPASLIACAGSP